MEIQGGKQPEKCEAGPVDRRALKKITLSASSIFRRVESGYLGSYEDGLAAGVSFRDLLPYERLTARPWCLDFTVHSFHDLFDRPFFLPFCITRIRRLRSFIHDRYPRKLFTKDETKEEIAFGNIYSEREKVFFKGWRFKSIDDTNRSRFEEERMENKLAYVIYSSLPRGRRSTNTRIKVARNRKVSREKEGG